MLYDPKWEVQTDVPKVPEPWRNALLKAAKLLDESGWCQGAIYKGSSFCALGAIAYATDFTNGIMDQAVARLEAHLRIRSLPRWNDIKARTAMDVIQAMRACATAE